MLRLDYFLMRGGLVVGGDNFNIEEGGVQYTVKDNNQAKQLNEPCNKISACIQSFTPRTNKGKQTMPSDFPVVATRVDDEELKKTVGKMRWTKNNPLHDDIESWTSDLDIDSWIPDIEKLLEQQSEYDKAQAEIDKMILEVGIINSIRENVMIREKEMMIVDAVNESRCEPSNTPSHHGKTHVSVVSKENSVYKEGEIFFTSKVFENNCWNSICTIEEYNQCIREMSEGAFVPNAKPEFVYGQDVYVDDENHAKSNLKFGCLSLNGKSAILLTENGYTSWLLGEVSSKPFKTKEEIELEEDKKKQVNFLHEKYGIFKSVLVEMQENGDLSEILLPLEPKQ